MLLWHGPSGNKLGLYRLKSAWVQACGFRYFGGENAIAASGGMDNIVSIFSSRTFLLFFLEGGRREDREWEEGGRRGSRSPGLRV
jgi:hypothetical protein